MANYIIPPIGSSGVFTLLPPFNSLILDGEIYTCRGIRTISDYIASNEDPFTLVYKPVEITEIGYEPERIENMVIVSLQSGAGQWVLVPAKYIAGMPINNGVRYSNKMIGVAIGAIPESLDLDAVQSSIRSVVLEMIGISSKTVVAELSKPVQISTDQHKTLETARIALTSQALTDAGKVRKLETELSQTRAKLRALEEYIKTHK